MLKYETFDVYHVRIVSYNKYYWFVDIYLLQQLLEHFQHFI